MAKTTPPSSVRWREFDGALTQNRRDLQNSKMIAERGQHLPENENCKPGKSTAARWVANDTQKTGQLCASFGPAASTRVTVDPPGVEPRCLRDGRQGHRKTAENSATYNPLILSPIKKWARTTPPTDYGPQKCLPTWASVSQGPVLGGCPVWVCLCPDRIRKSNAVNNR